MIIALEPPPEEILDFHEDLLNICGFKPNCMMSSVKLKEGSCVGMIIALEESAVDNITHFYIGYAMYWKRINEGYMSYPKFLYVKWDEVENKFYFQEVGKDA